MKAVVKYLSVTLILIAAVAAALLFSPAATRYATQKALSHFLKVDANVTEARFSLLGFNASGALNQTDTFTIKVVPLSWRSARAKLHFDGNVETFSEVATVQLPHIATVLDADFNSSDLLLELNASLLEGTLAGTLSLDTMDYRYRIDNVDLASFRTQQNALLPDYATGTLSAKGDGIITAPYTVNYIIYGQKLQLEKSATALISPGLGSPLPFALKLNGSAGADKVNTRLTLQSELVDINLTNLHYDFNLSRIMADLDLYNHDREIIPLNRAALHLRAIAREKALDGSYLLSVDGYRLQSDTLHYDRNSNDVDFDYRLTSIERYPLKLQGDHALFGHVGFQNGALSVKMGTKALNSPVLLTLEEKRLKLISTNISLEPLQTMANREVVAHGNIDIEADADLDSKPLLWHARVRSRNLDLPSDFGEKLGLRNHISVTIDANSEKNGDIVVQPLLRSDIGLINDSALRYKPALQLLFFNLNAKQLKTTYYKAPTLRLKGSVNLQKGRLNRTTLTTPYEHLVVNDLRYVDRNVSGHLEFNLSRLDRFGSLNRDYTLSGKGYIHHSPQQTVVRLNTDKLGVCTLRKEANSVQAAGSHLPLEALLRLTDQPNVLKGDLDYAVTYSPSSIKTTVTADELRGDGDLTPSIRPFALRQKLALKHKNGRYFGEVTLDTGNESLKLSNILVDRTENELKTRFRLDIQALEKSSYRLPQDLRGPLHLNGGYRQDESQHLTLNLVDFELPKRWHKMLDSNATSSLETNASLRAYSDKGVIHLNTKLSNRLLELTLNDSSYTLHSGDFMLKSDLKTALWFKDTNISAVGTYRSGTLTLPEVDITAAYRTAAIRDVHYVFADKNLTAGYRLHIEPYPAAPYHTPAAIEGEIRTKPKLYATMKSDSLGGSLDAYLTDTTLQLSAKDLSVTKLIAFGGKKLPVTKGSLDAVIGITSPSLPDGNLSTLKGSSDINITDMVLEGIALDDSLQTLRDSQDLNLFEGSFEDLPIIRSVKELPNTLTTKKAAKRTRFGTIRFLTDINSSLLHCSDCAIATDANLIAMKGDLNLTAQTFEQFYVGLLFPNNCAYFIQQIEGNLSEPQVQLAAAGFNIIGGATKSLVGNIGSVLDIGADIIKGTGSAVGDAASYVPVVGERTDKVLTDITDAPKKISTTATTCTPFYSGTVKHPKPVTKSRLKKISEKIEQR